LIQRIGRPARATAGQFLLFAAIAIGAQAQTFTTIFNFDNTRGANPYSSLVQATDGTLYGTTSSGGLYFYYGTVFKTTTTGSLSTVHSFDYNDGAGSRAAVIQATDGNFYGTTYSGGLYTEGTVFKVGPYVPFTTLHDFHGDGVLYLDGAYPLAALVQGSNGNFYGTTALGGGEDGCVFEITGKGVLRILTTFAQKHGYGPSRPAAALIQTTAGRFYGTSQTGGVYGDGTVFQMTPGGKVSALSNFDDDNDTSFNPYAAVVEGSDGNFYGTTVGYSYGTVFKVTPAGVLTTLYTFSGPDGEAPYGALVQATDGNFYGTTSAGGANGYGTIFEITPDGVLTTLHSFDNSDGSTPYAGLIQANDGNLYGTTYQGGSSNLGTIFSLALGLPPPQSNQSRR
jgi:uncharacterized repeat protein (TIGR03803 family)